MNKKKRRPSSRYVKLFEPFVYAATWYNGDDKLSESFTSSEERDAWINGEAPKDVRVRCEDYYISKPLLGIVKDYRSGMPVINAYNGKPDFNNVEQKHSASSRRCREIKNVMSRVEEFRSIDRELEDLMSELPLDISDLREIRHRTALKLKDMDNIISKAEERLK